MGTDRCSKPLVGLELNLGVYVIYIKMAVTCKNTEEENIVQSVLFRFVRSQLLSERLTFIHSQGLGPG